MRHTDRSNTHQLYRLAATWVLLATLGVTGGGPVLAQSGASPAELRRANDQLRERITELEAALIESQRRIETLESQIEAMSDAPGAEPPGSPMPRPGPTDPESRPIPTEASSCPDSLYGSLVDHYNEAFPQIELPAFVDVQSWIGRVRRDRQRVSWIIRVHATTVVQGEPASVLVNLVNPDNGEAICSNFDLPLPFPDALRINSATEVELWQLTGTLAANPVADHSRPEFDNTALPRLIGPFAVFGWTFDVQHIKPALQTDVPDTTEPQRR